MSKSTRAHNGSFLPPLYPKNGPAIYGYVLNKPYLIYMVDPYSNYGVNTICSWDWAKIYFERDKDAYIFFRPSTNYGWRIKKLNCKCEPAAYKECKSPLQEKSSRKRKELLQS